MKLPIIKEALRRSSSRALKGRDSVACSSVDAFVAARLRLAGDEVADVRGSVARNHRTPPEVLERLAGDKDWQVRRPWLGANARQRRCSRGWSKMSSSTWARPQSPTRARQHTCV